MHFNRQIKICQLFFHVHVRMPIPCHTTSSVKNVICGQIPKCNDRQYFRLYSIYVHFLVKYNGIREYRKSGNFRCKNIFIGNKSYRN